MLLMLIALFGVLQGGFSPAFASDEPPPLAVRVVEGEKHLFKSDACAQKRTEEDAALPFDECGCAVTANYIHAEPAASEPADASRQAAEAVNKALMPEKDLRAYCVFGDFLSEELAQAQEADFQGKTINEVTITQEVTHRSSGLLGVRDDTYLFMGGAHGLPSMRPYLFDTVTGLEIPASGFLKTDKLGALEKHILQELKKRPEGEIFSEVSGQKSVAFFNEKGMCVNCMLLARHDGLYVVFPPYAVGPYSSGFVEVKVPAKFIAEPRLTAAFKR